jgi:hypothetical protein
MPRNRKRLVDKIIVARMDGAVARCGDCGQRLWLVVDGQLDSRIEYGARGKRFSNGVWRPTSYSDRQRKRADLRLLNHDLPDDDWRRERSRVARNMYAQAGSHDSVSPGSTERPTFIVAVPTATWPDSDPNSRGANFLSGIGPRDLMGKKPGGTYRLKDTRHVEQVSSELAEALRLPAKVQCPRCSVERAIVNVIDIP